MSGLGIVKCKTNPVLDQLRAGKPSVGCWVSIASPSAAELLAHAGWDWMAVDCEHSPYSFDQLDNCLRAIQLGGAVPIARVPYKDPTWIQRALDAGAMGVCVPNVNTADEARMIVDNVRYYPEGHRTYHATRLANYIDGDYRAWVKEHLMTIVMLESIESVENAEEIMAVDGIDACMIGIGDLAMSMGFAPSDRGPGTEHEKAVMRVLEACKATGKAAGTGAPAPDELSMRVRQGFQFVLLGSDMGFMNQAARQGLAAIDID